ncbi:hypothetical protein QFZ27_001669 [Inquilinus ginsengisoli]
MRPRYFEMWGAARHAGSSGPYKPQSITAEFPRWPSDAEVIQAFTRGGLEVERIIGVAPVKAPEPGRNR